MDDTDVMELNCEVAPLGNKAIIAAALDMYEACKHAFELLDFHGTDDPDLVAYGYIAFPTELVDALFNELATVIAKAEGREPDATSKV